MVVEKNVFNCEGWKALNRIASLTNIHNVFFQNALCLNDLLLKICEDSQISQNIKQEAFEHLQQYIFNYLASSSSLTDIARRFIKYYEGTEFYANYETKVLELFKNNNLSCFIKDLRNNQIHCEIPFPYTVSSLDGNKSWDIIFITKELLESKFKWKVNSKKFINQCGDVIKLTNIFTQYTTLINSFYMWLYIEFNNHHKDDFNERNHLLEVNKIKIPKICIEKYMLPKNKLEEIFKLIK